jgi:glutamine synthetase adenylyltransferase
VTPRREQGLDCSPVPRSPQRQGGHRARVFVRLSKRLVGLLQDVTEDGFAFELWDARKPKPYLEGTITAG